MSIVLLGISYLVYEWVVVRQLKKHRIEASDDFEGFRVFQDVRRYIKHCGGSIWVCVIFAITYGVLAGALIHALVTTLVR